MSGFKNASTVERSVSVASDGAAGTASAVTKVKILKKDRIDIPTIEFSVKALF
jgi:hypothetical protein